MSDNSANAGSVHAGQGRAGKAASRSPFRQTISALLHDRLALAGLIIVAIFVIAAIFAPLLAPQNPYDLAQLDILDGRLPPGSRRACGSFSLPRRVDRGCALISALPLALPAFWVVVEAAAAAALVRGAAPGLTSPFLGGPHAALLRPLVHTHQFFPAILIALIFLAILGQGVDKIILALIVTQWAYYARTIRGSALVERKRAYVDAARSMALPDGSILFRHILPNCLPPLIVVATMRVAYAIMLEATLSFLGIGLPVTQPSLGLLISNGFEYLLSGDYWISFFPGLALLMLIVGINLIGDALRDILNPRREG